MTISLSGILWRLHLAIYALGRFTLYAFWVVFMFVVGLFLVTFFATNVFAATRHHPTHPARAQNNAAYSQSRDDRYPWLAATSEGDHSGRGGRTTTRRSAASNPAATGRAGRRVVSSSQLNIETARIDANENAVIGGRPAGCPHAFCGCGLRKYLGIEDKSLDLAWNWAKKFRHTSPAPGVAAVRAHHVMLLVSHVEGSTWVVRDYNGGRHLSYIHERNVRGYVFVDPSARLAMRSP